MSDDPRRPQPISAAEADQFSDQALSEHDTHLQQARRGSIWDFAIALSESFARAQQLHDQEKARRRAEWEASPEGIDHKEQVHRNRSECGK